MPNQVVHFEIIGRDPNRLRSYFGQLFGWTYDLPSPVVAGVSQSQSYGFIDGETIPGGVGGGDGFTPRAMFYVGVDNVEAALLEAERLGGTRIMGPARKPGLVVAHFADPEGNVIGLAGPG